MAKFTTHLIVTYIDGTNWKLTEPFEFYFHYCRAKRKILRESETNKPYTFGTLRKQTLVAPEGTYTDFASIPKWLHSVFSPTGKHGKAAVVHDLLYRTPELINKATNKPFTKKEADLLFLIGMEVLQVSWVKRKMFYQALLPNKLTAW